MKFYTGLPNLACLNFTWNLIQPYTENIKYWDKKKEAKSHYQGDVSKRKPGRQRQLTVKEEYLIVLCRLRLDLLNQHLGDIFGVSESTISQHWYAYWLKSSMGLYFGGHLVKKLNANFPSLSRNTRKPG